VIPDHFLAQRWGLPLDCKVEWSRRRIIQWYEHWRGDVYVAFSGGKDSTALLHLVRSIYPRVPAVFVNTGLEFPEIVRFARRTENITEIRPAMKFPQVLKRYGYPVVSKRMAQYIHEVSTAKGETATKRLRLTGIRSDGTLSKMNRIAKRWLYLCSAPFKISHQCCHVMKKRPAAKAAKEFGAPYLGTMAAESQQRQYAYLSYGCNAFDLKWPKSSPLAIWLEDDVWSYLREFDVPYSPIYNMGYERTGCMFCMFGVHLEGEPNRFQRMAVTHPKIWRYCMDKLGLREVLKYLGVPSEPSKQEEFAFARGPGEKTHA